MMRLLRTVFFIAVLFQILARSSALPQHKSAQSFVNRLIKVGGIGLQSSDIREGRGDGDTIIEENSPFDCPGFGVFPHPTRCEWYYTCYFGDSVKLWACFSDWLFDLRYEGCNFPEETDCGDREKPGAGTTETSISTIVGETTSSASGAISSSTSSPGDFSCPGDGFFPIYPGACSNKYYTCIEGVAYLSNCPGDSIYDEDRVACVPLDQANCTPDFECPSDGFFPLGPDGCFNQYWTCVRGKPYVSNCPGTSVFDPSVTACIPVEISSCAPETTTSSTSTSTTQSTTPSSTTTELISTTTQEITTSTTEITSTSSSQETTTTTEQTTTSSTVTPSSTSSTISSTSTTTKNPGGGFVCPRPDGRFPNPDDCHSFYTCIGGVPYLQNCPPDDNLVFNPSLEVCDYPQNVPDNQC